MTKRSGDCDQTYSTSDCDSKRRKLEEKEHLSCLKKETEIKQKLEEVEAKAALYKLKCQNKEEELNERRQRVEELCKELKRTNIYDEMCKREAKLSDVSLRFCLETGRRPIGHGPNTATAEEIACCSYTGDPTDNVCTLQ